MVIIIKELSIEIGRVNSEQFNKPNCAHLIFIMPSQRIINGFEKNLKMNKIWEGRTISLKYISINKLSVNSEFQIDIKPQNKIWPKIIQNFWNT